LTVQTRPRLAPLTFRSQTFSCPKGTSLPFSPPPLLQNSCSFPSDFAPPFSPFAQEIFPQPPSGSPRSLEMLEIFPPPEKAHTQVGLPPSSPSDSHISHTGHPLNARARASPQPPPPFYNMGSRQKRGLALKPCQALLPPTPLLDRPSLDASQISTPY